MCKHLYGYDFVGTELKNKEAIEEARKTTGCYDEEIEYGTPTIFLFCPLCGEKLDS